MRKASIFGVLVAFAGCDATPPEAGVLDRDGDGTAATTDCDDTDPEVQPGAAETCDGRDNDCDGAIDDADSDVSGAPTWYADADADGFGTDATAACARPDGAASEGGDCDDSDPTTFPGAPERCDGIDNGCDGNVDEACHPAPSGALVDADVEIVVLAPFDSSRAGTFGTLSDLDGDGLDDVTTLTYEDPNYRLWTALGPLAAGVSLTPSEVTMPVRAGMSTRGWALGADVSGDGIDDFARVEVADDLPPTVRVFAGPFSAEMSMEEGLFSVVADNVWGGGYGPAYGYAADVSLVPGSAGTPGAVLITAYFDQTMENPSPTLTVAIPADTRGEVSLAALADTMGGEPWEYGSVAYQGVGDLDGDGFADAVRSGEDDFGWIPGPLSSVAGPLELVELDLGEWDAIGVPRVESPADLDGDGTDDLLVRALRSWTPFLVVLGSRLDGGTLTLDIDVPLILADSELDGEQADFVPLDTNGDGRMDLAFSTVGDDPHAGAGAVWLTYGPFEATRSFGADGATIRGSAGEEHLGNYLAAGDTNGDGLDDLLMGSGLGVDALVGTPVAWVLLGGR